MNRTNLLEVSEDVGESVDGQWARLVDADERGAQLGVSSRHLSITFYFNFLKIKFNLSFF